MRKTWNFLKEFAWPFGLCGGVFGILVRFVPNTNVSLWPVLAWTFVGLGLVITLIGYIVREQPKDSHPRVEQVLEHGTLLLIGKNEILGLGMGAQLYYRDHGHELFVGEGSVVNVQSDGRVQLRVTYHPGMQPDLLQRFTENRDATRNSIVVRPAIMLGKDIQGVYR